jgi:hypothetical protein
VVPVLSGEVRVGSEPLTDGIVVLHRVSSEFQGEIDSVRVRQDGSFAIRLPYVPDHEARSEIFFASLRFRDILYFGPAITDPVQLDSLYLIQAYDTASAPAEGADLPLQARNVFLEKEEGGWRVTDVFQILNEGNRTLFSPSEGRVWGYPLPVGSTEFELGQSDLPEDAIQFLGGHLEMSAPVPPGERFLLVRYFVTGEAFDIPLPGRTDRMEIFLREPGPSAQFPPLLLDGPVELEPGNVFRRFAGEGLRDVVVHAQLEAEPWRPSAEVLGLLLAALLGAAGVVALRRRGVEGGVGGQTQARDREAVLFAIARLDEAFDEEDDPGTLSRNRYAARRRKLLAELDRDS